jgi:PAS domain S-box-containing protein
MEAWLVFLVAALYICLLFAIAIFGDKSIRRRRILPPALVYSLSLAVYCTSWTYYGAVGRAAVSGLEYIAIYLSPILLFLFGTPMLKKIVRTAKRQNIASIADYLSSRYGKRSGIAMLVTIISTLAIIPYIALQLKAVSTSIEVLTKPIASEWAPIWFNDTTMLTSFAMILFAILFGTRQVDVTEHHRGLILAIAFESLVKLTALLAIAVFVVWFLFNGPENFLEQFRTNPQITQSFDKPLGSGFWTQALLAAGAILCLPRQFHIMVVENVNIRHLNTARWVFPIYLILVSLVVIPITSAGLLLFPNGDVPADTFVLNIPLISGQRWLSLLVFIGGFSAATAMVVIATLSLSTMLSNDVILPIVLRLQHRWTTDRLDISGFLLYVRRLSIAFIILAGYFYHRSYGTNEQLSTIGLIAFSLVIQLTPSLLAGIYWKKANAWGVYAGIIGGFIVWFYTLMLPTLVRGGILPTTIMDMGVFGWGWLKPEQLFLIPISDSLTHGVFWSLSVNILLLVMVSSRAPTRLIDRLQAAAFVEQADASPSTIEAGFRRQNVTVSDMRSLLEQFAGVRRSDHLLTEFEQSNGIKLNESIAPKINLVRYVERILSGIIGSSSARAMVHSVLLGRSLAIEDVVTFFDETTQALQFNQKLLSTTLENIDQGVSVIDRDMRLVAWNRRYLELFDYPDDFIRSGRPVEDLVRYNANRGECGSGDIEDHVERRMEHLRKGTPHRFIRVRKNGTVVEMKGNPLPGGGFVTTFNDITEHIRAKEALQHAKQQLEIRVDERTRTIQEMNHELREEIVYREEVKTLLLQAKAEAESANASKTRFLALASHDILQPLNAARLYTASLIEDELSSGQSAVVSKLNDSLQSTEELISTLLEIARLDDGALQPKIESFALNDILRPLIQESQLLAQERHIRLRWVPNHLWVHSDPVYLRRILQNLITNAIKYTPSGTVLVGCRKRGAEVSVQVMDTGPGIAAADQKKIFNDFYRISGSAAIANGVGLGLGVVSRLSALLDHPLDLHSEFGKGSQFSLLVPIGIPRVSEETLFEDKSEVVNPLAGLRVLCIDNQPENLLAITSLLERWGCLVTVATRGDEAKKVPCPQFILMDYQLDFGENGITLYADLCEFWAVDIPAVLITANAEQSIRQQAQEAGMAYLRKPVKPAPLRATMTHLIRQNPLGDD